MRKTLQISEKDSNSVEIFAPPFISTFYSTSNGNILPFFACLGKTKNPDFAWKSGFYCLLLFFKVVPPGIEPGTQGFSVLCSTNWAMAPTLQPFVLNCGCKNRQSFRICKLFKEKVLKNHWKAYKKARKGILKSLWFAFKLVSLNHWKQPLRSGKWCSLVVICFQISIFEPLKTAWRINSFRRACCDLLSN